VSLTLQLCYQIQHFHSNLLLCITNIVFLLTTYRLIIISKLEIVCTHHDVIGDPTFFFKEPKKPIHKKLGLSFESHRTIGESSTSMQPNPKKMKFGIHTSSHKKGDTSTITPIEIMNLF
jgi:hypothetical protein